MDLPGEVKQTLGIDDATAIRAVGTVFRAVRMTLNAQQFRAVYEAFPHLETWLKTVPIGGGRTAEMLAIVGPEALDGGLKELGLDDAQIHTLCRLVGRRIEGASPDTAKRVAEKLPALKA